MKITPKNLAAAKQALEAHALGVDVTPPALAPPVQGVRVGATRDGLVRCTLSERRDELAFTPDQAQALGRALLKHAQKARRIKP